MDIATHRSWSKLQLAGNLPLAAPTLMEPQDGALALLLPQRERQRRA